MENFISVPMKARVDVPLEGELSGTLPNQMGNVAGAHSSELHQRLLETGGRSDTLGPLKKVYVFWLPGMSCDGCTVSTIGATEPSIEELLTGALPGVPVMVLHHYQFQMESGDHFTYLLEQADAGALDAPFILVYEGSITDENLTVGAEPWAAKGSLPTFAPAEERQRRSTPEWVRRLAPRAAVTIAIGTCATWGGIPASLGNPTGAMSMMDFLGKDYRSGLGLPVVNVPGCPPIGDDFTETVTLLLKFMNGQGPLPDFDELGRPAWQFGDTVHLHCPRGSWYAGVRQRHPLPPLLRVLLHPHPVLPLRAARPQREGRGEVRQRLRGPARGGVRQAVRAVAAGPKGRGGREARDIPAGWSDAPGRRLRDPPPGRPGVAARVLPEPAHRVRHRR
jgi:hypothetical protein